MARTTRSISLQPELMFKIEDFALEMDYSFSEAVRELCMGALAIPFEKPSKDKETLINKKRSINAQLTQIEKELAEISEKEAQEKDKNTRIVARTEQEVFEGMEKIRRMRKR
jgi:hypothetical protein